MKKNITAVQYHRAPV